jgi:hypothetical protein
MVEMMFGSGSPMWSAIPAIGLPYQLSAIGAPPITATPFNAPFAGGTAPGPIGAQRMTTPIAQPLPIYGYGGGMMASAQPNLNGPGLAGGYPFASISGGAQIADATGVVTAVSILAAVALRRGQPQGPTNDGEVEEFIYDALDLLPGASDVEVRCETGRLTLSGSVQHKRTKRDVGEISWAIPGLHDVQNNVSIASRRRSRSAGREPEAPANASARKQG